MKQIICLFLTLALVVGLGSSCRKRELRTIVIRVPAMKGEVCKRIVTEAVVRTPGVIPDSVVADTAQGTVTVEYDSIFLARKNIEFAIAEVGFAANDVPAKEDVAAKLPAECR